MISLAQQNGGPAIAPAFNGEVLAMRRLLETIDTGKYTSAPPEFALILRVNGSLANYGVEGVEKPILRKDYIQVDIVVSEQTWTLPSMKRKEFLAEVVGEAIDAIGARLAKEKRLLVHREILLADYAIVAERFLNQSR